MPIASTYRFDETEVLESVRKAALEETSWDSGFVFNTLCCRPHRLATCAYLEFSDRNLLKEQSTEGRRMERDVVGEYSGWFGAQDQAGLNGYVCSGGTEGNFVALWAAKSKIPKRRKIILSRYAHYSYDRFAGPLELQMVPIPLQANLELDTEQFLAAIDEETLCVIVTAGDPVLGRVDALTGVLESARAHGCAVHIDGAYGGYFLPFLPEYENLYQNMLALDGGVTTLTLDPHKYGLCPLGTGLVLFSDKTDLDRISLSVVFPPIESRTFQGSRSAGPAAAAWAMARMLGREGYAALAKSVVKKRLFMEERFRSIEGLEFVIPPQLTSVGFRVRGSEERTKKLFHSLGQAGYRITPQVRPFFFMRVIVHHHTELSHIERFCDKIQQFL